MSVIFFEGILEALGERLIFSAVSNYAGNSFFEKSWDTIMESYPLSAHDAMAKGHRKMMELLDGPGVKIARKGQVMGTYVAGEKKGKS